ncbi:alpha/beta hydrolase [Aeromicrobium sp. Root236]|uniref:alpha/beta fold hydrolase n=1 Tax=Aeromicrobium sp. Root236 TaxID=1736498 RepID=UPI0006FCF02F|nr:alpha/beta hydrolase [Aeromicrobium sp. Root236]KRC65069.1 alpha/beta hydrolase [Aeromicrobium sp. Root236]
MLVDHDVPTVLGRIRVRTDGDGPAMAMWPSLLMDGDLWAAQAAHFADRFTVLVIDPPGHGASEALTRGFTFEECATVIEQVLDHVGVGRAHVLGNSWGGMIGGTFAALHPDRVGVAVLMNATASTAGRHQRIEYAAMLRAAHLLGGIRPPLTRSVLKAFLGPTSLRTRPEVVRTVRASLSNVDMASATWAVRSVVPQRPDQRDLFARISTPVLVVAGEEDATFRVAETWVMAESIPGADFVVIDGAAHLAALEVPDRVNALVAGFLAKHT